MGFFLSAITQNNADAICQVGGCFEQEKNLKKSEKNCTKHSNSWMRKSNVQPWVMYERG